MSEYDIFSSKNWLRDPGSFHLGMSWSSTYGIHDYHEKKVEEVAQP